MKRKLTMFISMALMLSLALTVASCSSNTGDPSVGWDGAYDTDFSNTATAPGAAPAPEPEAPAESWDGDNWYGVVEDVGGSVKPATSLSEKIIYSASVQIETTDFEGAVSTLEDMLDFYGAFLESSSVSGKSWEASFYGYDVYRTATYTIRVPVESFGSMRDSLDTVGSVLSERTYTDNITEQYYDTQSRVDAYRIEQERLLDMLEKCQTVSEMIEVEARLSEVRYQLESLESTLRNWQNEVDYSTLDVTITEVEEYTEKVEPHRTYWQQVGDGLKDTLNDVGRFFKDAFKGFIIALPVIAILAVLIGVILAAVLIPMRRRKKRDARSDGGGQDSAND